MLHSDMANGFIVYFYVKAYIFNVVRSCILFAKYSVHEEIFSINEVRLY